MPGGNGMGPGGMGPLTGRGTGNCAGAVTGSAAPMLGRGRGGCGLGLGRGGRGRQQGMGAGFGQAPAMTSDQELAMLKGQAEAINQRLNQLSDPAK